MHQLPNSTIIKSESNNSPSTNRLEISSGMQAKSIKEESDFLEQSEIHIKTEPREDESEYSVMASTSYEMCTKGGMSIEIDEAMIKIEHEISENAEQDPLDVSCDMKEISSIPPKKSKYSTGKPTLTSCSLKKRTQDSLGDFQNSDSEDSLEFCEDSKDNLFKEEDAYLHDRKEIYHNSGTNQSLESSSCPSTEPKSTIQWFLTPPSRTKIPFLGQPGLKVMPEGPDPIDFFKLIVDDEILDLIIRETNSNGKRLSGSKNYQGAHMRNWQDISREDFEVFLGLVFLSGQVSAPSYQHYWQKNDLYNFPIFRNAMSRDRFLIIWRALHFATTSDEEELNPKDPLYKVRPLVDLFEKRMKTIYAPKKELSLDEGKSLWGDSFFFRNKAHQFGIKGYMLTQIDGIALKIKLDCAVADKDYGKKDNADKIAKYLLNDYFGLGHSIFMTKFYSGVALLEYLLEQKTYATGALAAGRKGNPSHVIKQKLEKREVASIYTSKGTCVLKCHDNQLIISSEYEATKKPIKDRYGRIIHKPEALIKYNEFITENNNIDHILNYYPNNKTICKWYVTIAFHIFYITIYNAYLLFKNHTSIKSYSLLQFRESIISALIYKNRPNLESVEKSLPGNVHTPVGVPRNNRNRKLRKRCMECLKSGKKVESPYYCAQCENSPGLCLGDCFIKFHNYG